MQKEHVLSIGEMMRFVEDALEARFEVHRSSLEAIPAIVARHGPRIRAIETRGREPTTSALIDQLPALEIIANFGVGYDSIDLSTAVRRGIVVTNTPQVLDDEVADYAVALLLATVRQLPQADRWVRTGRWLKAQFPLSSSLRDRTIGIIGMGRISERIARRNRVPPALLENDNVVALPHIGSGTQHTRAIMGELVVDNLFSWFDGHGTLTPVPETPWPRHPTFETKGGTRLGT